MLIAFDTETYLIGPQQLCPKLVCLQAGFQIEDSEQEPLVELCVPGNETFDVVLAEILSFKNKKVLHNAAYDLGVLAAHDPTLTPFIFENLEKELIHDTKIREKLLNLAEYGMIDTLEVAPKVFQKLEYKLSTLVKKYLGIDIEADKKGEDAWRMNYASLDGVPLDQWPSEAKRYAIDDAVYTMAVYKAQETRREAMKKMLGLDPLKTEGFRVAADFSLFLMSSWGIRIDPVAKKEIEDFLEKELAPEKLELLVKGGILRPAQPPRPHARGAKNHVESCLKPKEGCSCPPKMTGGVEESIDMGKLRGYVEQLATTNSAMVLVRTDASERFPDGQISVSEDWLAGNAHLDPMLLEYRHRQKLQKLVTTEMPRMNGAVVHPCYDVLKRTGRTSSFASKNYPSLNIQNLHPKVRGCLIPRDGSIFWDIDYSQLELATAAQQMLRFFGKSVLAEKINAGIDVHAYTGAQLAYALDRNFQESIKDPSPDAIYRVFKALSSTGNEKAEKFYKHWRKFAKPTNLGYPGGLGAETFVEFARKPYDVIVDVETAKKLRQVWLATYPEFAAYLNEYVNEKLPDPHHEDYFRYLSPYGMYRANCPFCAAANGAALQTPAAEGALTSVFNVVRACYDPSIGSILYGDGTTTRPIGFIHDELLGETTDDAGASDRVKEIGRIMVEAMREITPDVAIRVEPAMMKRWDKSASAKYGEDGAMVVWEPDLDN